MIQFKLPTHLIIPRKTKKDKVWAVNLNSYRNTHYRTLNELKIIFSEEVKEKISNANTVFEELYIIFIHHPKNNNIDTANVLSVAEKFFCDAIQPKLIKNDSRREIKGHFYFPGSLDKESPHIEVLLFGDKEEFLKKINSCYDG